MIDPAILAGIRQWLAERAHMPDSADGFVEAFEAWNPRYQQITITMGQLRMLAAQCGEPPAPASNQSP